MLHPISRFISWIIIALVLLFLPRLLLNSGEWLDQAKFGKKYANLARLTVIYPLLHIVGVPAVAIWAARTWQTAVSGTFFLAIIFFPLAIVGLLKALIEIMFGVSTYLGPKDERRRTAKGRWVTPDLNSLTAYQHKFMRSIRQVRSVGVLRLVLCLFVLSWLPPIP